MGSSLEGGSLREEDKARAQQTSGACWPRHDFFLEHL